jgi:hypothetical protein
MVMRTINREEIGHLADRLSARATSRLWEAQPELRTDLLTAVKVIRAALSIGFPVRPIDIDEPAGAT